MNKSEQIQALAKKLESTNPIPEWAQFVKTGQAKERPPTQENWWQLRSASVLLQVKEKGPIGVNKLRTRYGSRKNMGVRPEKFKIASGKILRVILQQLEKAELVKKGNVGVHKGRMLTKKGAELIK